MEEKMKLFKIQNSSMLNGTEGNPMDEEDPQILATSYLMFKIGE